MGVTRLDSIDMQNDSVKTEHGIQHFEKKYLKMLEVLLTVDEKTIQDMGRIHFAFCWWWFTGGTC
jgi:hypothetical protein